jgi:hypothetical protein
MAYTQEYYHATRKGQQPLSLIDAQAVLTKVEQDRFWVEAKPETIELTENEVLVEGKPIGVWTPRIINAAKNYTKAPVNVAPLDHLTFDQRRVARERDTLFALNDSFRNEEFDNNFMFRVNSNYEVTGMVTTRYQHLPFDTLLQMVPTNWVVPRMQIDSGFCDIHVCHPDRVEDSMFGARISTSDIGLMRAMMFMQILVLVCSNGMVSVKEVEAIKRFHLGGMFGENIIDDWHNKVASFVEDFAIHNVATREALRASANVVVTEADAAAALLRLEVGPVRIKAALEYATKTYGKLTKFAVAQGLTHASQVKSLRSKDATSIKMGLQNDLIATQYLAAA